MHTNKPGFTVLRNVFLKADCRAATQVVTQSELDPKLCKPRIHKHQRLPMHYPVPC